MVGSSSEVVDYDVSRIRCGGGMVHGLSRAAAAENGAHIYKFRVPDMSRNSCTEKGGKRHDGNENVGNASCKILYFGNLRTFSLRTSLLKKLKRTLISSSLDHEL